MIELLLVLLVGFFDVSPPTQDLLQIEVDCAARGGELVTGRTGAIQCLMPQADWGQACTTALDCTGYCIGGDVPERDTCSRYPIGPGCTDFLDETGAEVSICAD